MNVSSNVIPGKPRSPNSVHLIPSIPMTRSQGSRGDGGQHRVLDYKLYKQKGLSGYLRSGLTVLSNGALGCM